MDYAYCLFETSVREAALDAIHQSKRSLKITVPLVELTVRHSCQKQKACLQPNETDVAFARCYHF